MNGEPQGLPFTFRHLPTGDKLLKVKKDFEQFVRGCCILQHPLMKKDFVQISMMTGRIMGLRLVVL